VDYILKPFETGDLPKRMAEILREATRRKSEQLGASDTDF
jgi:DNA-binding response OmpR family regulator